MARLLDEEAHRFTTGLDALDLSPRAGEAIRAAAAQVALAAPDATLPPPPVEPERPTTPAAEPAPTESGLRGWWRRLWEI